MDAALAETVARSTREQAVDDARADLKELRRQAVEAGRERSRRITKTSRIDQRTGEIRYNPAGRLLRDWYLHVYINQLRARLGEPSVAIDVQQVEDTTAILRRLRPTADGQAPLRAVLVLRDTAIDDAATAATNIVDRLGDVGQRRTIHHAPDDRFDGDELRSHVTRHWYLRCYQDQLERSTGSQMPLTSVTDAEMAQVALVLQTRTPVRLMGDDGIPLITAHSTSMTELDRELALGGTFLVPSLANQDHQSDKLETLALRLSREWNGLDGPAREQWLRRADAARSNLTTVWSDLAEEAQTKIIQMYLRVGGPGQKDLLFVGTVIDAPPSAAARLMFAHQTELEPTGKDAERHEPVSRLEREVQVEQPSMSASRGQASGM